MGPRPDGEPDRATPNPTTPDPVTGAPHRGAPDGTRGGTKWDRVSRGGEVNQEAVDLHVQRIPDSPPGDYGCASPSPPTRLRIRNTPSGAQPPVDRQKVGDEVGGGERNGVGMPVPDANGRCPPSYGWCEPVSIPILPRIVTTCRPRSDGTFRTGRPVYRPVGPFVIGSNVAPRSERDRRANEGRNATGGCPMLGPPLSG